MIVDVVELYPVNPVYDEAGDGVSACNHRDKVEGPMILTEC